MLTLPEGVTHKLSLPAGWREVAGSSEKGSQQIYLQTPTKAAQKTHQVSVELTQGGRRRTLSLSVELVRQVT